MSGSLILIGGGARSGKSAFALAHARSLGAPRVLIATAEAGDEEMRARIARHRRERGADFETLEVPLDLVEALADLPEGSVVVLDCLTLWLSNLLCGGLEPEAAEARVEGLVETLAARRHHALVVTNEVGLGLVPADPLSRAFRDVAGRAHQRLAASADQVYLAVMGCVLRLKPGPVELTLSADAGPLAT